MGPVFGIVMGAWAAAAVVALAAFAVILRRRGSVEPAARVAAWRAYRWPGVLMIVATGGAAAPSILMELSGGLASNSATPAAPPLAQAAAAITGAWMLLVAGVLITLFAVGEPARGRKRCGRCWYDMSGAGAGLQCPECGRTAKGETGLLRTRRRKPNLLAAVLMALLAWPVWISPNFADGTWPRRVPALLPLMLLSNASEGSSVVREMLGWVRTEQRERLTFGPLTRWVAVRCARAALHDEQHVPRVQVATFVLRLHGEKSATAVPRLLDLLDSPNANVRKAAAEALSSMPSAATSATSVVLGQLDWPAVADREKAIELLLLVSAAAGPERVAPQRLLDTVRHDQSLLVRRPAAFALAQFKPDERIEQLAADVFGGADPHLRYWAILWSHEFRPDNDQARRLRLTGLQDQDAGVRRAAALAIASNGPLDNWRILDQILCDPHPAVVSSFLHALPKSDIAEEQRRLMLIRALDRRCAAVAALYALSDALGEPRALLPQVRQLEEEAVSVQDLQLFNAVRKALADLQEPPRFPADAVPEAPPIIVPPPIVPQGSRR